MIRAVFREDPCARMVGTPLREKHPSVRFSIRAGSVVIRADPRPRAIESSATETKRVSIDPGFDGAGGHAPIQEAEMGDRYTKVVLTVIAAALAVIAMRDMVPAAHAQMGVAAHVVIDSVAPYAFQYAGPLPVKVEQ